MKRYHLTVLRDGKYQTLFGQITSIAVFLKIEIEFGRETHILYSRELSVEEYEEVRSLNLIDNYNDLNFKN